jgi:hypothetical protein
MEIEEHRGLVTDRSQLRNLADGAASEMIDYLVEKFDGDYYGLLKTRPDIWPPIDTTESEPLTRLVAAVELEHAAHAAQRSFIRQARETGRSWYEIGQALDLLWYAIRQQGIRRRRSLRLRPPIRQDHGRQTGLRLDLPGLPAGHHRPRTLAPGAEARRRPRFRLLKLEPPD